MMVRNEYPAAFFALLSVLPAVSRALVVDTGSTDGTLELLEQLRDRFSEKIQLIERPVPDSTGWAFGRWVAPNPALAQVRQWMVDHTETPYIWLVDGDEVYRDITVQQIQKYLSSGLPPDVNIAFLPLLWFGQDINHLAATDPPTYHRTGRLFRCDGMTIKGTFPGEMAAYGGEIIGDGSPGTEYLMDFEPFHHYEMVQKPWRRKLLGLARYDGPQPEVFQRYGTARRRDGDQGADRRAYARVG